MNNNMKKEFTKEEMETYREHGVSEGYRNGFKRGVALMSVVTVIITFALIVVVNQLIQLV